MKAAAAAAELPQHDVTWERCYSEHADLSTLDDTGDLCQMMQISGMPLRRLHRPNSRMLKLVWSSKQSVLPIFPQRKSVRRMKFAMSLTGRGALPAWRAGAEVTDMPLLQSLKSTQNQWSV